MKTKKILLTTKTQRAQRMSEDGLGKIKLPVFCRSSFLLACLLSVLSAFVVTPARAQGAWTRENHLAEQVAAPQILTLSNTSVLVFGTNTARTADGRVLKRF